MQIATLTRKLIAWILIVQLLWIPVEQGLQVLCIGDDGHVALEMGMGPGCETESIGHSDAEDSALEAKGHCGPCRDFRLGESRICPPNREELSTDTLTDSVLPVEPVAMGLSFSIRSGSNTARTTLPPIAPPLQLLC